MGLCDQRIEVFERPEDRVDIDIVRDVVAEVPHRRREEGRYPDRIRAEPCNVGQTGRYPLQIADAIAIGILKGARIDLIDHRAAPPIPIGLEG